MPQLEGPTTKNIQLCTGGLWGEKGKNKIFKKKKNRRCEYKEVQAWGDEGRGGEGEKGWKGGGRGLNGAQQLLPRPEKETQFCFPCI